LCAIKGLSPIHDKKDDSTKGIGGAKDNLARVSP